MAFEVSALRLFGLDLTQVAAAFRLGVEGMLRWPALAWLSPPRRVRVTWPDGQVRVCAGTSFQTLEKESADFQAVVLPADISLAHSVSLPLLSESDIAAALELQLLTLSPLPLEQIVWGWRVDEAREDALSVTLAFALKHHVDAFLAHSVPNLREHDTELWADVRGPVVLRGFAEARRERAMRSTRRRLLGLVMLLLALVALLPAAHFWQVRARVFDAQTQFDALNAEAAPYVADRAALVRANERAKAVRVFRDRQPDLPWLLETLSEILPDHTWLARLDVEGRKVRISGQSGDAAALMESLRARPEFAELRALSPIARGRDNLDSFNFEFVLASGTSKP